MKTNCKQIVAAAIETLESRTLLSLVTAVIHFGEFLPSQTQCAIGPGGPKRPYCLPAGRKALAQASGAGRPAFAAGRSQIRRPTSPPRRVPLESLFNKAHQI